MECRIWPKILTVLTVYETLLKEVEEKWAESVTLKAKQTLHKHCT